MKYIFIINKVAGNGEYQAQKLEKDVTAAASELGLSDVSCYYTKYCGDTADFVKNLPADGAPYTVIACGGDGTLRDAVNGIKSRTDDCDITVGVLPCGTGNDFVRAFNASNGFLDIKAQLTGHTEIIDLIKVDNEYCINLANAGFDANVAERIQVYKKTFGKFSYKASLIRELFSSMKYPMKFEFDDGTSAEGNFLLLSIANGVAYGGGYYAASMSIMNDGLLDVCYCDFVTRRKFIACVGNYKAGKHLDGRYPFIHRKVCKSLKLTFPKPTSFSQDGEMSSITECNISVVPNAIKLNIPAGCSFKN